MVSASVSWEWFSLINSLFGRLTASEHEVTLQDQMQPALFVHSVLAQHKKKDKNTSSVTRHEWFERTNRRAEYEIDFYLGKNERIILNIKNKENIHRGLHLDIYICCQVFPLFWPPSISSLIIKHYYTALLKSRFWLVQRGVLRSVIS